MMIKFNKINKQYAVGNSQKVIVEDLTLDLPKRNIAILGENGAGKSTMLRLISGTELPDSGKIDRNVKISFPLGFAGSFNASLSGAENSLFVSRIYGQDTEAIIEYVKEFSELGDHLYMPVKSYSSGMRARLAFGISLAMDFECYLIDEITAVGDQKFRIKSRQAFQKKLKNANLIMVSHSNQTLKEYCDMGLVIRNGQAKLYDNLEDAIEDHEDYMKS